MATVLFTKKQNKNTCNYLNILYLFIEFKFTTFNRLKHETNVQCFASANNSYKYVFAKPKNRPYKR